MSIELPPMSGPGVLRPGEIAFAGANPNAGRGTLGVNDFFKLLTAQLSAQDPLNPMKDTEFVAQMANLSSLEMIKGLSETMKSFAREQSLGVATSYLGKFVTVKNEAGESVDGVVESVVLSEGKPMLVIGGERYEPQRVESIRIQIGS